MLEEEEEYDDDDDDDERGVIGGLLGRVNRNIGENMPQCHFVYYKSNMS
jgi:hypothetical protein